jgi:glycosyltransferase involved in cell wall biosynthesis
MKVGLFSTSDSEGGAPRATFRLFQALRQTGTDASLVVQRQRSQASGVIPTQRVLGWETSRIRIILDRLPAVCIAPVKRPRISPNWVPDSLPQLASRHGFDVVNLHLVNCGFVQVETLAKFRQPLVWTLHDMWAFTGGCSYVAGCSRFEDQCGRCPLLGAKEENDLSRRIWQRKEQAWRNLNLTIVTPSRWMKSCVQRSSLLGRYAVECIPYGIDTDVFRPEDRMKARQELGLPIDCHLVLFGATAADSDPRKGFDLLAGALARLPREISGKPVVAAVFGNTAPVHIPDLGIPMRSLGPVKGDHRLRLVYSAADVFAAPSREDNLPNTVIESLACGTPVVAFEIGGMPDMIFHERTGRLVPPFDTTGFGAALTVELGADRAERRAACRQSALERFNMARQANAYRRIYERVRQTAGEKSLPPVS